MLEVGEIFVTTRALETFEGRAPLAGTKVLFMAVEGDQEPIFHIYKVVSGPCVGMTLRLVPGSAAELSLRRSQEDIRYESWAKIAGMCPIEVTVVRPHWVVPGWVPLFGGRYVGLLRKRGTLTVEVVRDGWVFSHPGLSLIHI